jgi:cytochrome P450
MVYEAMGPPSIFSALSNEDHRMRRDPLNPFFSRRNILRLEDNVRQEVEKFLVRLEKCAKTGEPLDISAATRAVAFDAVTDLCFEFTYDAINREDLGAPFMETVEGLVNVWMMNIYMPGEAIFTTIFNAIPPSILEKMDPGFTALTRWLRVRQ